MRLGRNLIAVASLAGSLALVACGSDDGSSTTLPVGTDTVQADGAGGADAATPDDTATTGDEGAPESDTTTGDADETPDTASKPTCAKGKSCYQGQCCTCSPVGCDAGIDNSLSGLSGLVNSSLQGSLDDASVNLVAEMVDVKTDGTEFTLNMYSADLAANNDGKDGDEACDATTATCDWIVSESAFKDDCTALIAFNDAKIEGTKLTAGGPDGEFRLAIPIQGFALELIVTRATIDGEVTIEDGKVTAIKGILAGAVPKQTLADAVDKIPADKLPIDPKTIKNLLDNVVKSDIDALDAEGNPGTDGVLESASIGIVFEGIPGRITGVDIKAPAEPPADADAGAPPAPEGCQAYPEVFSEASFRINKLALGKNGKPGEGLDVDGICAAPDAAAGELCPAAE